MSLKLDLQTDLVEDDQQGSTQSAPSGDRNGGKVLVTSNQAGCGPWYFTCEVRRCGGSLANRKQKKKEGDRGAEGQVATRLAGWKSHFLLKRCSLCLPQGGFKETCLCVRTSSARPSWLRRKCVPASNAGAVSLAGTCWSSRPRLAARTLTNCRAWRLAGQLAWPSVKHLWGHFLWIGDCLRLLQIKDVWRRSPGPSGGCPRFPWPPSK